MSTRRKFLRDVGLVTTLPIILGNLSPSCSSVFGRKPVLPVYLTHCHHWLNVALWESLLDGHIRPEDLPDMELDHYDSHDDVEELFFPTGAEYDPKLIAQRLHESDRTLKALKREFLNATVLFGITNHNTLGIYQGFFSRFNWKLPNWNPLGRERFCVDGLERNVCLKGLDLASYNSSCGEEGVSYFYAQQPVANHFSFGGPRVVTVDLDFFSLSADMDAIPQARDDFNFAKTIDERERLKFGDSADPRKLSYGYRHPLTDEEFEDRDRLMEDFARENFDVLDPPKMVHICESPLYCPREHGPALMNSLVGALTNRFSAYDVRVIDLRPEERKWDTRYLYTLGT